MATLAQRGRVEARGLLRTAKLTALSAAYGSEQKARYKQPNSGTYSSDEHRER
jgi:hypothetical protein